MNKMFFWATVVFWMVIIFLFSHQSAGTSSGLSLGITERVAVLAGKVIPFSELDLEDLHHYIRKTAHFLVYMLLGVLSYNAVRISKIPGYPRIVFALLICVLFAISDEMHQLFVPGRSGEVRDIFIDSIGAGVGIAIFLVSERAVRKIKRTEHKYDNE